MTTLAEMNAFIAEFETESELLRRGDGKAEEIELYGELLTLLKQVRELRRAEEAEDDNTYKTRTNAQ